MRLGITQGSTYCINLDSRFLVDENGRSTLDVYEKFGDLGDGESLTVGRAMFVLFLR